jgi:hypothetical protein
VEDLGSLWTQLSTKPRWSINDDSNRALGCLLVVELGIDEDSRARYK